MFFCIETKMFQENLNNVMLASNQKDASIPSISCIKFDVDDYNSVKMTAYNLTVAIEIIVKSEKSENGSVCINSKTLSDIIFKCNNDFIEISSDENDFCTIKSGKAKFQVSGLDSEQFPKLPLTGNVKNVSADSDDLIVSASDVIYAVAIDDRKPIMRGICLEFSNDIIDIVGCDGYRLARRMISSNSQNNFKVTVHSETIDILNKILGHTEEKISMSYSRNFIVFNFNNGKITSRLLSGEYLDWKNIIPNDFSIYFEFNKRELTKSIEMSLTVQNNTEINGSPLVFEFNPDTRFCKLSLKSVSGEFDDEVQIVTNGERKLKIAFNPKYVLEAIRHTSGDIVRFWVKESLSPAMVSNDKNFNDYNIILPVITR